MIAALGSNPQRVFWQQPFRKSEHLYMIDGAVVHYAPNQAGIDYEHHLIRENICIIEKPMNEFYGLPVGETVEFILDAKDSGLISFLEVKFEKKNQIIARFYDLNSKSVSCRVPDYDDFQVRVHVRGNGRTQLLSVVARVTSLEGLFVAGDTSLSSQSSSQSSFKHFRSTAHLTGFIKVSAPVTMASFASMQSGPLLYKAHLVDNTSLLVTFSHTPHYLLAEFATADKPQIHFASQDGSFEPKKVLSALIEQPVRQLKLYHCPLPVLQALKISKQFDTITEIE